MTDKPISDEPSSLTDPILALAAYWIRADYMRQLVWSMRDDFFSQPEEDRQSEWPEFQTYLIIG